jgi:hypothetical protein
MGNKILEGLWLGVCWFGAAFWPLALSGAMVDTRFLLEGGDHVR